MLHKFSFHRITPKIVKRVKTGLHACLTCCYALLINNTAVASANIALGYPEKEEITLGFIKLTDMAPLAVAYERGYFEDEGLYVTLEAQANWKVLLDGVVDGRLDGAHMLAGQPLAARIGYGTKADLITPFSMNLNSNAITVANDVWQKMKPHLPTDVHGKVKHPITADALKPVIDDYQRQGKHFNMGMVFPVSTHNYELRYWLAASGIHPGFYAPESGDTSGLIDAQVQLSVTPPPQMPATMEAGTIKGYCVGEPWNQQALKKGLGVPVITNAQIWHNNPEKVLGLTEAFAKRYPYTTIRLTRALLRATKWLDENNNANRVAATQLLAQSQYVGADAEVIASSMTGTFEFERGDKRLMPDFNVFFRYNANFPYYSDAIWFLTQMRRWGQISEDKPDQWFKDIARSVYRPEIFKRAVQSLIDDKLLQASDFPSVLAEDGYRAAQSHFIDDKTFDAHKPNAYLAQFAISKTAGIKQANQLLNEHVDMALE
ncbi:CmpA/NrtA family ABC transporter substrate-binding protein [Thalassotalea fusca]